MRSTLLFVDGHPVAYTIEQSGERFTLYPCHDSHPEVVPPWLYAYRKDGRWVVEGCQCQNLYDQVVEDLEDLTPALSWKEREQEP